MESVGMIVLTVIVGIVSGHALFLALGRRELAGRSDLPKNLRFFAKLMAAGWFYLFGVAMGGVNPYFVLIGLLISTFAIRENRTFGSVEEKETADRKRAFPLAEIVYYFGIGTMIQYGWSETFHNLPTLILAMLFSSVVYYEQQLKRAQQQ